MRGDDPPQAAMFSSIAPEERVPPEHPLRPIRQMVDAVFKALALQFDQLSSHTGRPSIAPEQWRRALLRPVLSTVRRERLLRAPLADNLLVRWFVGLNMDDAVWDASTFRKSRERLLEGDGARAVFAQVVAHARERALLSDAPFTVDGTLRAAWAGPKSCTRKAAAAPTAPPDDPGHPSVDFQGERRTNATPAAITDPEARLDKKAKGQEATRCALGPTLREPRHGLVVDTCVTQATGTAEREAALAMVEAIPGQQRLPRGADQNDDTRDFVRQRRELRAPPPVAPHTTGRASALDGRTTRQVGDPISQQRRHRGEAIVGWMTTGGWRRKPRQRGVARGGWRFTCAAAVYNLVRMRTLAAVA